MYLLQIFAGAFAIFALSRVLLRAKEGKLTWGEMLFWVTLWATLIFFIFWPETSSQVAELFGIGRGVDLVLYGATVLMFYLLFRLYIKVEQIEHEVTKTVRELALKDLPENKEK